MSLNVRINSAERNVAIHAYQLNIEENKARGENQLISGNQPAFTGWPESVIGRFLQVTLEAGESTLERVQDRVVTPLQSITERLKIPAILTGLEDIPPHITFVRADLTRSPEINIGEVVEKLKNDHGMQTLRAFLVGSEITMDKLVMANASYICTSEPSVPILGVRKGMNQLIAETIAGEVTMVPYNLAQVSSMRLTGPISQDAGRALIYEAHERIGRHLETDPLVFKTRSTFLGTASDHVRQQRAALLK